MASPLIDPRLKEAKISLPIPAYDRIEGVTQVMLYNSSGDITGVLGPTDDWSSVPHFALFPDSEEAVGISTPRTKGQEFARERAFKFLADLFPQPIGQVSVDDPKGIDIDGLYKFLVTYRYREVTIQRYRVNVNYRGNIAQFYRIDIDIKKDEIPNIPEPPDKDPIIKIVTDFCIAKGITPEKVTLDNRYVVRENKRIVLYWSAKVSRQEDGKQQVAYVSYREEDKTCTRISRWMDAADLLPDPPQREAQVTALSPVWTADGKGIWFSSNGRWPHLADWWTSVPYSLARISTANNLQEPVSLCRPLPDYLPLNISYRSPSPSPDGRWLAFKTGREILAILDLTNSRIYNSSQRSSNSERVSWSRDSARIAYTNMAGNAYLQPVSGKSGMPFEGEAQLLPVPGECTAIEFLPNADDKFVAVYRPHEDKENKEAFHVVLLQLEGDNTLAITPLLAAPKSCPYFMHVTPDGQSVLLLYGDADVIKLDIATKTLTPIPWLKQDAPIGQDASIIIGAGKLNWDVSPDMQSIIFTATALTGGTRLMIARMDGTDMRQLTSENPAVLYARYTFPDGQPLVRKNAMTVDFLERMKYLNIEWPKFPPPDGPRIR